jgi:MFS transporter, AAHS family, 4-hydroxybenzoate transporter
MHPTTGRGPLRSLESLLDTERLGVYQVAIITMCALIAMLDGFDTQAIGFVAPAVAAELHLPIASFGPVFAAGLLGGLIGALGFGLVADRFGRRKTLLATMLVIAFGSLLTIRSSSSVELMTYRFVTGLGLGGAMPSIIAITAEYAPQRLRATLVTAMFCGFPLGAVVGAVISSRALPVYGWRSVFVAGGVLPCALLPLVILAMPESIRWLASRQRTVAIEKILARMNRADSWDRRAQSPDPGIPRSNVPALFAAGRGGGTALLWIVVFFSLLLVYLLVSWIPAIAQQAGRGPGTGALAAAALNLGGIGGSLVFGRLMDRLGSFRVVSVAYLGGTVIVIAIGLGTDLATSIYWFASLAGFFCIGAQLCVIAIASDYYPIELRTTGVGWAMGVGRVGAIAGPLVGGLLMRDTGEHDALFVVLAIASLASGLAVLGLRKISVGQPVAARANGPA